MLVGLGGCERSVSAYAGLLAQAGLHLVRVWPAAAAFSVVEAAR